MWLDLHQHRRTTDEELGYEKEKATESRRKKRATHTTVETGMTTTVGMRDGGERRALHCRKSFRNHFYSVKPPLGFMCLD